jgi:hypothetical protein
MIIVILSLQNFENWDQDDPDHPKNDSVYCWRARRLLAAKCLRSFEGMHDGDLAKVCV